MATRKLPGGVTVTSPDPLLATPQANGLAPGWTQNPDGSFSFSPSQEQQQGITLGNGDVVQYGPDGQTYVNQHDSWLVKALPYLIAGGMGYGQLAGLLGLPGAAASESAAAGAGVPSMPWTIPAGFEASMGAAPAGAGAGAGAAAAGAAGAGAAGLANGSSLLKDILTKYAPLGLAGLSAVKGFQQPSATGDLNDVIGLAKNRVQESEPLFQALNRMAMSGLPNYAKQ